MWSPTPFRTARPLIANVKEAPEGTIGDMLMASAYLIGFRQESWGANTIWTAAGINNVPVDVLIDKGYKDIIVLRIYGYGIDTEKKLEVPGDVNLYHVAPRQDLGGILEFDRKRARRNMLAGYFDGRRMLYGLAGRIYYIDAPEGEPYYFDKMMSEIPCLMTYLDPDKAGGCLRRPWGHGPSPMDCRATGCIRNGFFPCWQRN